MKWSDVVRRAEDQAKERYTAIIWADMINECLEKMEPYSLNMSQASIALESGQTEYDIPSTLNSVREVIYTRGTEENRLPRITWANRYGRGYQLSSGKIRLQRITIQTGDGLILVGPLKLPRITVNDIDPVETSSDITLIPDEWQWLLVSYCVFKSREKEGWLQEAKDEEARWFEGLYRYGSSQNEGQLTHRLQRREYY